MTTDEILGRMLVEALRGDVTEATITQLRKMPMDIEAMPQPFRDLVKQAAGTASTGRERTLIVLDELHGACEQLLETL
jgi:hypothetical protein